MVPYGSCAIRAFEVAGPVRNVYLDNAIGADRSHITLLNGYWLNVRKAICHSLPVTEGLGSFYNGVAYAIRGRVFQFAHIKTHADYPERFLILGV